MDDTIELSAKDQAEYNRLCVSITGFFNGIDLLTQRVDDLTGQVASLQMRLQAAEAQLAVR